MKGERTRIFTETGKRVSGRDSQVSEEERAVRAELRALGTERAGLLAEIAAQEVALRGKQSTFAQARNVAAKMPGRGKKRRRSPRLSKRSGPNSPCCKASGPT